MTQSANTFDVLPTEAEIDAVIRLALAEDMGDGDVTTLNTIPADGHLQR